MLSASPSDARTGRSGHRFSFEARFKLWLTLSAVPPLALAAALAAVLHAALPTVVTVLSGLALAWFFAASLLFEGTVRPLQTLANIVGALREDDFSFRARNIHRGDALGALAFEINTLANTIQRERVASVEALALVERVLASMQSPVLAFDARGLLRLRNAAAGRAFTLPAEPLGMSAGELGLADVLSLEDLHTYPAQSTTQWSVRRTAFRLHGLLHTLVVFTDVGAALQEEERLAWQRLIRVLSHEINNSLTPIQSIAGSLHSRASRSIEAGRAPDASQQDLLRGLSIIEERAVSLNRFLQSYQSLARLPAPVLQPIDLSSFLPRLAGLETRLPVAVQSGPHVTVACDPDQLTQALINLLSNAADAALEAHPGVTSRDSTHPVQSTHPTGTNAASTDATSTDGNSTHVTSTDGNSADGNSPAAGTASAPSVTLSWRATQAAALIDVVDNGLGVASTANLFVPFYTTKPNGSGIGLVLVKQIASAHGGGIALTSNTPNAGCTATLVLPLSL